MLHESFPDVDSIPLACDWNQACHQSITASTLKRHSTSSFAHNLNQDRLFVPAASLVHSPDASHLKNDCDLPPAGLVEWDDVEDSDSVSSDVIVKTPYRKRRGFAPCNASAQHGTCDGLPPLRKISDRKTLSPSCDIQQEPSAPDFGEMFVQFGLDISDGDW
eukprot:CAMPEP_0196718200 /NCGR_PEP_ID=MMETSP1091-20130531/1478_1 /TAXON_ID=302021 /ORGANISM="Rhodomonas sp., Strain CCMP768" /LENGTH=161 /DNA_ID=CAMNT_0042058811 /DNA_START=99 /DNA_END=581 /DNA_ORIENTATION=-